MNAKDENTTEKLSLLADAVTEEELQEERKKSNEIEDDEEHNKKSAGYRRKSPVKLERKTASNEIDEQSQMPPPQPTLRSLYNFYIPCLGLGISGPLLSLVDTASVGLTAKPGMGAFELGALGPATTFIDGSTYLFAFLNIATTNLYANTMARNADDEERSKLATDAVVRAAAKISVFCGLGIMGVIYWKGEFVLSLYIGEEASKTILKPASEYILIRALSMPTALLVRVVQASFLGAKDSVTPLIAVVAATIVNILGDGCLVFGLQMGVKGAAIATLVAQWAGTIAMYRPAMNKLIVKSTPEQKEEHKVTSKSFLVYAGKQFYIISVQLDNRG